MFRFRMFARMLKLVVAHTVPIKYKPRTMKQKKWAKAYIETGSSIDAVRQAYPNITRSTAETISHDNMQKLDISHIFEKAGLTDDYIAKTLYRAMRAKRPDGKPDWLPRLKSSEMALKVRGHFKERIEHMGAVGVYPILGGISKGEDKPMIEGEEVAK